MAALVERSALRTFDRRCPLSKPDFNGVRPAADLDQVQIDISPIIAEFVMSNTSTKIALALAVALAVPAVSFAQSPMGRTAGQAGSGNVPISGIPPGPGNAGGMNNATVDPSGIGNASRMAPLPPPRISAPVIPKFK
jgi:hypothetical protein